MKRYAWMAILLTTITLTCGCGTTEPVYNVGSTPVASFSDKHLTSDQVRDAILQAMATAGWKVTGQSAGRIEAGLDKGKHLAFVTIDYSQYNFSIVYDNSINLRYDGANIHRNYNTWIKVLEKQIDDNLLKS